MLFRKSNSQVPNQLGHKSSPAHNTLGKKYQQIHNSARSIHNILDTVHKVKSILEK